MEDIEVLKKKIAEYENRMGIGETDPAKDGYLVLVEILRQQNAYLSNFKIEKYISSEDKGNMAAYKNAKDLWENLSDMIKKVSSLRFELKMDGEEQKNIRVPVTPQSMAKLKN